MRCRNPESAALAELHQVSALVSLFKFIEAAACAGLVAEFRQQFEIKN